MVLPELQGLQEGHQGHNYRGATIIPDDSFFSLCAAKVRSPTLLSPVCIVNKIYTCGRSYWPRVSKAEVDFPISGLDLTSYVEFVEPSQKVLYDLNAVLVRIPSTSSRLAAKEILNSQIFAPSRCYQATGATQPVCATMATTDFTTMRPMQPTSSPVRNRVCIPSDLLLLLFLLNFASDLPSLKSILCSGDACVLFYEKRKVRQMVP